MMMHYSCLCLFGGQTSINYEKWQLSVRLPCTKEQKLPLISSKGAHGTLSIKHTRLRLDLLPVVTTFRLSSLIVAADLRRFLTAATSVSAKIPNLEMWRQKLHATNGGIGGAVSRNGELVKICLCGVSAFKVSEIWVLRFKCTKFTKRNVR